MMQVCSGWITTTWALFSGERFRKRKADAGRNTGGDCSSKETARESAQCWGTLLTSAPSYVGPFPFTCTFVRNQRAGRGRCSARGPRELFCSQNRSPRYEQSLRMSSILRMVDSQSRPWYKEKSAWEKTEWFQISLVVMDYFCHHYLSTEGQQIKM